jgi:ParB family transcriptional regulator, chromosome partitioning protein
MNKASKWRFARLDVKDIDPDPKNPRRISLTSSPHDRLLRTIARHGLDVPIQVFETKQGRYQVADGHVRLAACLELEFEHVPAMVYRERPTEAQLRADQIVLNEARAGLDPFEQADAYQLLVDACGGSQAAAVRMVGGVSRKLVNKVLRLRSVAPAIRSAIQAQNVAAHISHRNRVTRAQIYEVALADSEAEQQRLARLAMNGIPAKRLAKERKDGPNRSKANGTPRQGEQQPEATPDNQEPPEAEAGDPAAGTAPAPDQGPHTFVLGDYDDMTPSDIAWPPTQSELEACGAAAAGLVAAMQRTAPANWKTRGVRMNWDGRKSKDGPIRFYYRAGKVVVELEGPKPEARRKALLIAACAFWDWASQSEV